MSRTILLADDSVTIQKVIELTFMDEDYTVVAVGDGDAALEALDDGSPDVVIADVHMPGANGYDVARHAKSVRPGTPVLLLVGTFEPFDEDEAARSGADRYLKKPFDSQELQQIVEELLAGAASGAAEAPSAPATTAGADDPFELDGAEDDAIAPATEEPMEASASPFSIGLEEPDMVAEEVDAEGASQGDPAVAEESIEAFAQVERGGAFDQDDSGESFALEDDESPAPTQVSPPPPPAAASAEPTTGPADDGQNGHGGPGLSDEDVDRIALRVVELMGDGPVRDVAWEVIPDVAESVIRSRLRELESQVE